MEKEGLGSRRKMLAKESVGPIFDIPNEALEVMYSDPFEQLDVAQKITSIALSTRVSVLKSENSDLNNRFAENEDLINYLESQIDFALTMRKNLDPRTRTAKMGNDLSSMRRPFFHNSLHNRFLNSGRRLQRQVSGGDHCPRHVWRRRDFHGNRRIACSFSKAMGGILRRKPEQADLRAPELRRRHHRESSWAELEADAKEPDVCGAGERQGNVISIR